MRTKRNKIRRRRRTGKWILSSYQPHKVILGQRRKLKRTTTMITMVIIDIVLYKTTLFFKVKLKRSVVL